MDERETSGSVDGGRATTIVIFGATGDLTRRKLIPALFNLCRKGRLSPGLRIVGFARSELTDGAFVARMRAGVDEHASFGFDEEEWRRFAGRLSYLAGDFGKLEDCECLSKDLAEMEEVPSNRIYYLATAPRFYVEIVDHLASRGMTGEEEGWRRVVVEKPFGRDLRSARDLNEALHARLHERQIYRMDHYLGKETVQNILVFRFANAIFEPIWNRNYIDHVQITVSETVGVGHRADYYERSGVLRDMFQNHILQLVALTAMEYPAAFEADAIRNEKVKVMAAIRPFVPDEVTEHTVCGRYRGYLEEDGVAADSRVPTFAAARIFIDNWRWQGVPFYLRSGKRLARKTSEILIQFKSPPHMMFPLPPDYRFTNNVLAICIQPDEGIHLRFEAKVPDTAAEMRSVDMEFHYAEAFGPAGIPEAYERLLLDALAGDASLFARSDGVELGWRFVDPIVRAWESPGAPPLAGYERGSWGPEQADAFVEGDGRAWLLGCGADEDAG